MSKIVVALFFALALVLCAVAQPQPQPANPGPEGPSGPSGPSSPAGPSGPVPDVAPVNPPVTVAPVQPPAQAPQKANPTKPTKPIGPVVDNKTGKWINIAILVATIIMGLLWCFVGYRLLKVVLFLAGFVLFYFIAYNVLVAHTSLNGDRAWISMAISAGAGILGGIMLVLVFKIGVFILGFIFGAVIATLVVAFTPLNGIILHSVASSVALWVFLACIVGLGILVGIVAVIFTRPIVIFVTAWNGAYLVMSSIDTLTNWNILLVLPKVLSGAAYTQIPLTWTAYQTYVIFGGIVLLGIAGIVVQAKLTARGHHHDPAVMDRKPKGQDDIPLLEP